LAGFAIGLECAEIVSYDSTLEADVRHGDGSGLEVAERGSKSCTNFTSVEVGFGTIWVSFYGSKSMLANWGTQSSQALQVLKDLYFFEIWHLIF